MNKTIRDAQRHLDSIGLEVLSLTEIEDYNDHRFDNGHMNPVVRTEELKWYDHGGYLSKQFYVKHPDYVGVLRTAYYYPDGGAIGGNGSPLIILEDETGSEIGEYDV